LPPYPTIEPITAELASARDYLTAALPR
jgi:hypothetical protein